MIRTAISIAIMTGAALLALVGLDTIAASIDATYPVQPALLDASGQPDLNARDWR